MPGPATCSGRAKPMSSTTEARTAITPTPSPALRLHLQPERPGYTLLDGGWWPHSADPAAELPGLILALDKQHGPITRIMLGMADWDLSRPRQLRVDGPAGSRTVWLGWFATMPAGLVTTTSARGQRTDLLTVPPDSSEQAATAAMDQAAQAGNRTHTPAFLAAITAADIPDRPAASATETAPASTQLSTWEWEGGHGKAPGHIPPAPAPGPHGALVPDVGPEPS